MNDRPGPVSRDAADRGESFDAFYFEHCCGLPYRHDAHWITFFGSIADRIIATLNPGRVLDAGCAMGFLVEALRARGVDAAGIDVSAFALANVPDACRPYCHLGSITEEFQGEYDLVVSIEVLEHMPARDGEVAIANICRHTSDVLFSSSPTDHREPTHVNVQPPEYWAELFAGHGFYRDVDFDASFITPWAARFRRSAEPLPRIVRQYERQFWTLAVDRNDRREYATEVQAKLSDALDKVAVLQQAHQTVETLTGDLAAARAALEDQAGRARALDGEVTRLTQELRVLRGALEETHAHQTRKILELDAASGRAVHAEQENQRLRQDLAQAQGTIHNMERSIFWRARKWLGRK